eukprot:767168-Hanusia_phi.AAC.2
MEGHDKAATETRLAAYCCSFLLFKSRSDSVPLSNRSEVVWPGRPQSSDQAEQICHGVSQDARIMKTAGMEINEKCAALKYKDPPSLNFK